MLPSSASVLHAVAQCVDARLARVVAHALAALRRTHDDGNDVDVRARASCMRVLLRVCAVIARHAEACAALDAFLERFDPHSHACAQYALTPRALQARRCIRIAPSLVSRVPPALLHSARLTRWLDTATGMLVERRDVDAFAAACRRCMLALRNAATVAAVRAQHIDAGGARPSIAGAHASSSAFGAGGHPREIARRTLQWYSGVRDIWVDALRQAHRLEPAGATESDARAGAQDVPRVHEWLFTPLIAPHPGDLHRIRKVRRRAAALAAAPATRASDRSAFRVLIAALHRREALVRDALHREARVLLGVDPAALFVAFGGVDDVRERAALPALAAARLAMLRNARGRDRAPASGFDGDAPDAWWRAMLRAWWPGGASAGDAGADAAESADAVCQREVESRAALPRALLLLLVRCVCVACAAPK